MQQMGQPSPMLFPNADASQESLVDQIKQIQRADPNAKEQWGAFTDMQGKGVRDPARHTPEFLQDFLTHLSSGGRLAPAPQADLSKTIKALQKSGPQFKQAWANFCMMQGGGRNDPAKHDDAFHLKFFEALAQQAAMSMGGDMSAMAGAGAKRDASGMIVGMGGGSPKDMLVNRLKAYQRSSPDNKELWATYTDTYLGGVRDPNRHDEATLTEFCDNHGVPNVGEASAMGAMGAMGGPMDPEKEMLVTKIKAYQKQSPECKEAWSSFCGTTKDPARHSAEKLAEFAAAFGL